MPEQRNRERRDAQWQREAVHPCVQNPRVPFVHAGDQVGTADQGEGGREAADDRLDLSFQPHARQGFVDGAFVTVSA